MPLEKAWKRISEYYRRMKTEMLYFLVCYLFLIGCNGKSNKETMLMLRIRSLKKKYYGKKRMNTELP